MNIEQWPIDRPKPYAKNARKIPQSAIDKVAVSLKEFGWQQPIVVDKSGVVVAGHTRLSSAKKLGLLTVPVHIATDLTPEQVKAYRLMDNRSHEEASWDMDLLIGEFTELKDMGLDMLMTGFDFPEIEKLLMPMDADDVAANEIPALPENPVSRLGDLWICGSHRVRCGDSTNASDLARLWGDDKVDACITDPPYGVGIDYGKFQDSPENVQGLIPRIMEVVRNIPVVLLTSGVPAMWSYPRPDWVLAWVHPAPVGGCPWGFCGFNPILAYGKDPYLKNGRGRRPDSLVLAADREGVEGYPTPKPFKVWTWVVERGTTKNGQIVFDPFLGSGTTMLACEHLSRKCLGMELNPLFIDVIVLRWQKFTGKQATLEGDGRTFEAVGRERGVLLETDVSPKKATAKAAKPARKKAKRTAKR